TTIRNLYSLWFPPADQVKEGPCTLVCNSTTNVVSCDPPPPSDSPCACALYSPTNYTGLSVALSNLSGPIPASIGGLLHLTYLNLQGNNFSGPIPTQLCQLTALQYMDLSNNSLDGTIPACFAALTNLLVLDLHHNQLSGPIPQELGSMLSLQTLFLKRNRLTGAIPSNISLAQNLTNLWVDNNTLNGHLPGPLGNLVNLISLDLLPPQSLAPYHRHLSLTFCHTSSILPPIHPTPLSNLHLPAHQHAPRRQQLLSARGAVLQQQPPQQRTRDLLCPAQHELPRLLRLLLLLQLLPASPAVNGGHNRNSGGGCGVCGRCASSAHLVAVEETIRCLQARAPSESCTVPRDPATSQGAFGVVYCAQGPADQLWAIKRSRMIAKDASESTVFETEVRTVSRLSHRNLVRLLGYCSERGEQILVYEFVPNGPLSNYLYASHQGACLDFQQRLEVAIGVAEGLAYLHSSTQPAMVHRDIKPANILLDAGWQAKIADFGLVKDLGDAGASVATRMVGTRGYLDPEYFSRDKVTTKADVYSFGVVLMELVTGRPASSVDPTSDNHATIHISSWTIPYVEDGDIAPISDPRIFTPEISEHLLAMSKIAKDCMQLPGKERPEMVDVARMLRDVRRRAFGVGAEEIQLDEVPASPLASLYSYHHSQPASGYGTDSYIEFSGPVPK
ncbi:unnamed protein product, partial [Closterium sp. Naga37s-1]